MTTTTPRQAFPPITCQPWCIDGDGHPDEHPEDQWCESEWHNMPMPLARKWKGADGLMHTPEVEVQLRCGPKRPAQVVIYEMGDDAEWPLLPSEARQLAAMILEAADRLAAGR